MEKKSFKSTVADAAVDILKKRAMHLARTGNKAMMSVSPTYPSKKWFRLTSQHWVMDFDTCEELINYAVQYDIYIHNAVEYLSVESLKKIGQ